jgi:hypothetical protein
MDEIKGQKMLVDDNEGNELDQQIDSEQDADVQDIETQADDQPIDDQGEDDSIADEVVVSIGEEALPVEDEKPAPRWVKELRKQARELQRENRELKARMSVQQVTETKPVQLGKKPTLEDCDYDSEQYEQKLGDWFDRKREHEQAELQARSAQEAEQRERDARLDKYAKDRAMLRVRDYEDAEENVLQIFGNEHQEVILRGAKNAALLVYALGKNQAKAKELASIKDPFMFAWAASKLEDELKVTNRAKAPPPEKTVSGTGRLSGSVDSHLERLRKEADRTGDITKVVAYRRQLKQRET